MSVLTGDWARLRRWFARVRGRLFLKDYEADMEAVGKAIQNRVKTKISRQSLPWVPLAESTVQKKGHRKIYIDTREYWRKVEAKVTRESRFSLNLVVAPLGKHESSGLSMQTLTIYLEYGTSRMPSRPLWRPVSAEVVRMKEFKRLLKIDSKLDFTK